MESLAEQYDEAMLEFSRGEYDGAIARLKAESATLKAETAVLKAETHALKAETHALRDETRALLARLPTNP